MSLSNNFPTIRPTLNLDFANSGVLDPRITFTRTTTATYYDAETVALAEQNLLLQSQTFENASWTKTDSTISADTTVAPDGTTTADTVTEGTSGTAVVSQAATVQAGATVAISVYAKRGNTDWIRLTCSNGSVFFRVWVNLATGAVGTSGTGGGGVLVSATATSAGSGWYRIVLVGSLPALSAYTVFTNTASADNSSTRVNNGTYVLWGAQLEQRSSVTAYTPTTTQAITNYIPQLMTAAAGQPRFDYDPITRAAKGLLIEEARTNLLTYSEQFDNAAWGALALNATVTANTIISPDGTLTADKLIATSATSIHRVDQGIASTPTTATGFLYAKKGEYNFCTLYLRGSGIRSTRTFNLTTGEITNPYDTNSTFISANAVNVGNGWWRLSISATSTGFQGLAVALAVDTTNNHSNSGQTFTGDGYSGIYIWGAQLEAGAFATSYIPTVASSVQRNADVASMTGTNFSSWYTQGTGTFVAKADAFSVTAYSPLAVARLSSTGTQNTVDFSTNIGSATQASRLTVRVGNVVQCDTFATVTAMVPNTAYTFSSAFATNDFISASQGSLSSADTSGTIPVTDVLDIGNRNNTLQLNGHIQYLRYYPLRLTNTQLQNLTKS